MQGVIKIYFSLGCHKYILQMIISQNCREGIIVLFLDYYLELYVEKVALYYFYIITRNYRECIIVLFLDYYLELQRRCHCIISRLLPGTVEKVSLYYFQIITWNCREGIIALFLDHYLELQRRYHCIISILLPGTVGKGTPIQLTSLILVLLEPFTI